MLSERLSSPRFVRRVSWVSGLIFVAGVVAIAVVYIGGKDSETASAPVAGQGQAQAAPPPAQEPQRRTVPVSADAKTVAGQFILGAVTREDLANAWKVTDPESELRQCGGRPCSYKEWLAGDIPIQPYPAGSLGTVTYKVDESYVDRVVLQVAILPKDGAEIRGQIFFIGLKTIGKGKNKRWVVDYWAPRAINPVPDLGDR